MTDNTKPEALDLADWLEAVGGGPSAKRCAALLREQHARIAELEAQLEAIGAGGVEPLRRRECLHQISEPAPAGKYPALPEPDATTVGLGAVWNRHSMRAYVDAARALWAQAEPAAVAEQGPVVHDEDLLEQMYWEFDGQRRRTGEERLAFKGKMRSYASEFRRRSDGKMTFAQSVSDDMMNLADRLGSEYDDVDPIAWKHLLVYAPKASPAATAATVPAGWVAAPREATEEMKAAAVKYANGSAIYKNFPIEALKIEEGIYSEVYGAMLAAAPTTQAAPAAQGDAPPCPWLQANDMAALERFAETTDDDESYDIGKDAVQRLAGFGCLRSHGFGKYSITDFGHYVLNDWSLARELPFKSQSERGAARSQAKKGGA